jgi:hypothetical protein
MKKTQNGETRPLDWHRYEEEKSDLADACLTADQYEQEIKAMAKRNGF